MKARKVLIPTRRERRYVGAADGVVTNWFLPFGTQSQELARAEAEDWLARNPQADLFIVTTESRAVRVTQVSEWWEVVRRDGRKWVNAFMSQVTCPTCLGAGRIVKSRKCRHCRGDGHVMQPKRFRTKNEASAAVSPGTRLRRVEP